jgi:hypothetical protein
MSDSSSLSIRPYRAGEERQLVDLFERVFGRTISEDHWRWKLKRRSSPVDNVWLAVSDDKPVFQYAGIPTRFWQSQTAAMTMVSVDTMTDPEFRRRGLLTRVASRAYEVWRESGVAFVIGLPNEQWGSRASALGWQKLFPLRWLVRPLRPEAMLARRLNVPLLKRATFPTSLWNHILKGRARRDPQVQTQQVRHAGEEFDQIWANCKADWMFSTVRDREWVDWRFLSSPSRAYEVTLARRANKPSGYAAHCLIGSGNRVSAYLAEIFAAREDHGTRDTLLGELLERLLATKAEALLSLAVPGTPEYQWLRRCGFFPRQAFSIQLVPLSGHLPLALMSDPNHWNLTGADFDVV